MNTALTNQPPYNIARFSGFFIESVLTGIYWVHFYSYIENIRKRSRECGENMFISPIFAVGMTLFIGATGHFLVLVISSFIALSNISNTDTPMDQRGYLSLSPNWSVAYNAFYIMVPVVADAFLIYRLFIVWQRNYIIAIPAACICVSLLATASVAAHLFTTSIDSIFDRSRRWIVAAFALTFACNIYCTFFISLRVWLAQRSVRGAKVTSQTKLQRYIEILVQSAALYCLLVCLSLIFSIVESNALYMSVAAGICFCMIVTRPYNAETGQTFAAVTSVPHHWQGVATNDEGQTMMIDEPPLTPDTPGSAGTEVPTSRDESDAEKGRPRSDTGDTEKRELENVIGHHSFQSTINMPPASESSDGVVSEANFGAEKDTMTETPDVV
ncbi:hypothetical protein JR316_0004074 [Psilocybe cubensis]|uniref:Uncharacterized protein n=1 Tax=Psilocybe cubensis TaxID=181762 RepID=A0ACB8HA93_PSICU|nr:hypothetical protein JR316_0004074 [Psilocybe cubensis]KAH9484592.1 hypothetical protein JR316_0004074 [Psilocybe cubensis]